MDEKQISSSSSSSSILSSSSFNSSSNGSNVKVMRGYNNTVQGAHDNNGNNTSAMGCCYTFQMPTHYPRYTLSDYESMSESCLDRLLDEYGLLSASTNYNSLADKRAFAINTFLWRSQQQNKIQESS